MWPWLFYSLLNSKILFRFPIKPIRYINGLYATSLLYGVFFCSIMDRKSDISQRTILLINNKWRVVKGIYPKWLIRIKYFLWPPKRCLWHQLIIIHLQDIYLIVDMSVCETLGGKFVICCLFQFIYKEYCDISHFLNSHFSI